MGSNNLLLYGILQLTHSVFKVSLLFQIIQVINNKILLIFTAIEALQSKAEHQLRVTYTQLKDQRFYNVSFSGVVLTFSFLLLYFVTNTGGVRAFACHQHSGYKIASNKGFQIKMRNLFLGIYSKRPVTMLFLKAARWRRASNPKITRNAFHYCTAE